MALARTREQQVADFVRDLENRISNLTKNIQQYEAALPTLRANRQQAELELALATEEAMEARNEYLDKVLENFQKPHEVEVNGKKYNYHVFIASAAQKPIERHRNEQTSLREFHIELRAAIAAGDDAFELAVAQAEFDAIIKTITDLSLDRSTPKATAEKLKLMADNAKSVEPLLRSMKTKADKHIANVRSGLGNTDDLSEVDGLLFNEFAILKKSFIKERADKQYNPLPLLSSRGIADKAVQRQIEQANNLMQQLNTILARQSAELEQLKRDLKTAQETITARLEAEEAAEDSDSDDANQAAAAAPSSTAITRALLNAHQPQPAAAVAPPGGLAVDTTVGAKGSSPASGSPSGSSRSGSSSANSRRDSMSSYGSDSDRSPVTATGAAASAPSSPARLPAAAYQPPSPPAGGGLGSSSPYALLNGNGTHSASVDAAAAARRREAALHATATVGYRPAA